MKKITIFETSLLILILLFSFIIRLYKFNNPIADWHSWRQSDTSAVSRRFIENGFNILYPKYYDISNVQTGFDNPHGYRFVEFPIYNIFQAGFFKIFHHFTLEEWGRLITIFSTLLAIVFIYLIMKKSAGFYVAIFTAFAYGFIPFNIYYGRTILPDPSVNTALLASIYFFIIFLEKKMGVKKIIFYVFSISLMTVALLLKPFVAFWYLPMVYLVFKKYKFKFLFRVELWFYLIFSFGILLLWRVWESKFPAGVPANIWLFNAGNIRFTGAYFWWLFEERISRLILGGWGLIFIILGILKKRKDFGFFISFLFSSLIYLIVIARGNVQHDYYQILIMPTIAIFFGLGTEAFLSLNFNFLTKYIIFIIIILFTLAFGWYQIRGYFNINNPAIVEAGLAVSRLTPKKALIIAPYGGDTSFLYQTDRKGWPSFETSLQGLIAKGATDYVVVHPSASDLALSKKYKILNQTNDYILFDLKKKLK